MKSIIFYLTFISIWASFLVPSISLAEVRDSSVNKVVEKYQYWRTRYNHPKYKNENEPFWTFIDNDSAVTQANLSFEEYAEAGRRLNVKYGYRISSPPAFSKTQYDAEFKRVHLESIQRQREDLGGNKKSPAETEAWLKIIQLIAEAEKKAANEAETLVVPPCVINSEARLTNNSHFQCDRENSGLMGFGRQGVDLLGLAQRAVSQQIDLKKKANNVKDVFEVIAATEIGRKVLKDFMPQFTSGKIKIEQLTPEVREKHKVSSSGAAAFVYDGNTKTIYIDKDSEVGVAAPLLLHEIVHSLDQDYIGTFARNNELWKLFRTRGKEIMAQAAARVGKPEKQLKDSDFNQAELDQLYKLKTESDKFNDIRDFRTERLAYGAQDQFIREFTSTFPCYDGYISAHGKKGHILHKFLSDDEIVKGYNLNSIYINEYKRLKRE